MKKKIIILTIEVLMVASFIACGKISDIKDEIGIPDIKIVLETNEEDEEDKDEAKEDKTENQDEDKDEAKEDKTENKDKEENKSENNDEEDKAEEKNDSEKNDEEDKAEEKNDSEKNDDVDEVVKVEENKDKVEEKEPEVDSTVVENEVASYLNYYNGRYGFSIQYPSYLIEQPEPANGDGRSFVSADGQIRLTASGINNVLGATVQSEYNASLAYLPNVSYNNLGQRSYVISGTNGEYVYYMCSIVGSGSINTFILEYPKARANELNEAVGVCYDSFTAGDLERSH